ncbi:MAG: hypothetical protein HY687_03955 [Chloroflexi bacterium]|nr:hypothetical protein [Chloroflexota bacterium]
MTQDSPPALQELLNNEELLEIYSELPPQVVELLHNPAFSLPTEYYRVILLGWQALSQEERFETAEQLLELPLQARLMLLIRRTSEAQLRQP